LEEGQLMVYRGTPSNPDAMLWQSKQASDSGSLQLGITASKMLTISSDVEGKRKVIWKSN
jgi:hypothetical protein